MDKVGRTPELGNIIIDALIKLLAAESMSQWLINFKMYDIC